MNKRPTTMRTRCASARRQRTSRRSDQCRSLRATTTERPAPQRTTLCHQAAAQTSFLHHCEQDTNNHRNTLSSSHRHEQTITGDRRECEQPRKSQIQECNRNCYRKGFQNLGSKRVQIEKLGLMKIGDSRDLCLKAKIEQKLPSIPVQIQKTLLANK
ncbi:unnamed protein product [Sphenostylis stenocarpa]|uniref:Uncharacterized protein n=1 Tax=Sphenostylis stenocarpa TaxID=92480 RepID=A0AA86SPN0_9FABA|nr:unnamed protein product [Sphenostylis stenocarpa]